MDVKKVRQDFSILINHPQEIYLDSAASSLKTKEVVNLINYYYDHLGTNVHRGAYDLSQQTTALYEKSREKVAGFINAGIDEVIFTRGTTTALNTIAGSFREQLKPGDEVITTELEHHSSIIPWMMATKRSGATLKYIPLTDEGRITVENFKKVLTSKTKVVAITYVSNVMGYITPLKEIIRLAHEKNAIVVVDGAQAAPHLRMDVKDLDCDFIAFSGHKMFGPTGVGVLYGKKSILDKMEPYEFGGEMIDTITKDSLKWQEVPTKFEAGTPVIGAAIGLQKAIEYIDSIGYENIHQHTIKLRDYTLKKLEALDGLTIYNKTADIGIITLNINGVHPHDAATFLSENHVAVRAGKHCAHLIADRLNMGATLRASFQIYNDFDDCDALIKSIKETRDFFNQF
ncbi:SufS family cysteine desulfurase [Mycoplasmatota bacterium]|nr:SufS family cysteine desulfurase [Mycoplasmatota bacterium]